jgi:hypothetical protein
MTVRGIFVLLLFGLCASVALAKPGIVKLKNGQVFEGDVDDKDPDNVVVTSGKIKTSIERGRIDAITFPANFQDQYNERMAKLGPKDVAGRLALASDAFNAGQYALARDAAESARVIDPNNAEAARMLETAQAQMRLERAKQQGAAPALGTGAVPAGRDAAGGRAAPGTQPMGDKKLLGPAEINAIRQAELRPEDSGVRVRFERDVKKRFINYKALPPNALNSMSVNEQVQRIVTEGTPEMRRDVQILSDPPALFQYRRSIQPFVLANCATAGCHGGPASQTVSLITPGDSDAAAYTNFYILQKYTKPVKQTDDSVFGRGDLRLIDRQHPEQSLLLQYAMPGTIAESDHPDVTGYRAPVRGPADPKYRLLADWIGTALQPVEPDYGFEFQTPGSATKPATQPASAPAAPATATRPAVAPRTVAPKTGAPGAVSPRPVAPRPATPAGPARPAVPAR